MREWSIKCSLGGSPTTSAGAFPSRGLDKEKPFDLHAQCAQAHCSRSQFHFVQLCPGWGSVTTLLLRKRSRPRLTRLRSFRLSTPFDQTKIPPRKDDILIWCPGWGSNPHALRPPILSRLRIPIPSPGRVSLDYNKIEEGESGRPRPGLNRCIAVLQTAALTNFATGPRSYRDILNLLTIFLSKVYLPLDKGEPANARFLLQIITKIVHPALHEIQSLILFVFREGGKEDSNIFSVWRERYSCDRN